MDILAMLIYGTLVQIHTSELNSELQFYKCNTDKGTVVNYMVDYPQASAGIKHFDYYVEHKCLYNHTVGIWYHPDQLRKIK